MSRYLTTATAVLTSALVMTVAGMSSSDAADVYGPGPGPGPVVIAPPPGPIVGPGQPYAQVVPVDRYYDAPIVINGQRFYRDCWWEWDRRVCQLKPYW